jgi:hypothetical protein
MLEVYVCIGRVEVSEDEYGNRKEGYFEVGFAKEKGGSLLVTVRLTDKEFSELSCRFAMPISSISFNGVR